MSYLALLDSVAPFVHPPQVKALVAETFALKEIAEAFQVKEEAIVNVVTRLDMFLISEVKPRITRRFHYFDCLALLVALTYVKGAPLSAKKTILSEVAHLLFGDRVALEEADQRRADVAEDRERSPAARAKSDKFLYPLHMQRREEIRRNPWSASPLWWSRGADRNFCLFSCRDHRIIVGLFDKRINGGRADLDELEKLGVVSWVNCTRWFCRADGQLAAIVERRRVEA